MTEREPTYALQLTLDEARLLRQATLQIAPWYENTKREAGLKNAREKLAVFERRFTPREEPLAHARERAEPRASQGLSDPHATQPEQDPEPEAGGGTTHA